MKKSIIFIIMACSLSCFNLQAISFKENILLSAKLEGSNLIPTLTTNAKGLASVMLSKNRDSITINISLANLSGSLLNVSLNNGQQGVNGSVLFDLTPFINGNKVSARITGSTVSSTIRKLIGENVYIIASTSVNPLGELRGQVLLESDLQFVSDLKVSETVPLVTEFSYGLGSFSLSMEKTEMKFKILCSNLSSAITSVKLHYGAAGNNGSVALDITSSAVGNIITGSFVPTTTFLDSLYLGNVYLNVTTTNNNTGELRTQLKKYAGISFEAVGTGAQMVPSVTTATEALGIFRLAPGLDTLYYDVVVEGASSSLDYLHLHLGYAGDVYGTIQVDFTSNIIGYRAKGFKIGTAVSNISKNRFFTRYLALIAHTGSYPTGEVRGEVIRYTREGYTINMTSNQIVPAISNNAYGSGIASISRLRDNVHYQILAANLSGNVTGVQFKKNKIGQNGNIIYDISNLADTTNNSIFLNGFWKNIGINSFTPANALQISTDSVYVNIETSNNNTGEIRGQIRSGHVNYPLVLNNNMLEKELNRYQVFPNPFTTNIQINTSKIKKNSLQITVKNAMGICVAKENINKAITNLQLDLTMLKPGIYFIYINDGEFIQMERLIKQ